MIGGEVKGGIDVFRGFVRKVLLFEVSGENLNLALDCFQILVFSTGEVVRNTDICPFSDEVFDEM